MQALPLQWFELLDQAKQFAVRVLLVVESDAEDVIPSDLSMEPTIRDGNEN